MEMFPGASTRSAAPAQQTLIGQQTAQNDQRSANKQAPKGAEKTRPRPRRSARINAPSQRRGLWEALSGVFLDPFRGDPDYVLEYTDDERDQRRRYGLLQLILVSIVFVQAFVVIPLALIAHATLIFPLTTAADMITALICIVINRLGHTNTASIIYIVVTVVAIVNFGVQNNGIDEVILLLFAAMTILIFIAGLVLPQWSILPTLIVLSGSTVGSIFLLPLSPHFNQAQAPAIRLGAAAIMLAFQIVIAVITWLSSLSANTGINAAARAAERERELALLKDQFIIDANHELRTPIMALYGNIELLRLLGQRADEHQRDVMIDRALKSGDAVMRLLSSVMDAGAMASAKPQLTLKPISLAEMVYSVIDTFDPREIGEPGLDERPIGARPMDVGVPANLVVMADETRLRQILLNLLSNALKYSAAGTRIQVGAQALPAQRRSVFARLGANEASSGPMAQIGVRDFGLGVPPEDAPKLFNRFVRLERDIAGPVRGTGVGLYLCRVYTEAMGGRIWVESSGVPGEGSFFTFTLPLTDQPPVPLEITREQEKAGA